jgi:hypothetical protein
MTSIAITGLLAQIPTVFRRGGLRELRVPLFVMVTACTFVFLIGTTTVSTQMSMPGRSFVLVGMFVGAMTLVWISWDIY